MRSRILHNKSIGQLLARQRKAVGWHFAGEPIVSHDGMLAGYVSVDAYIEQGKQQRLRQKCAYMQSRQMLCCSLQHIRLMAS